MLPENDDTYDISCYSIVKQRFLHEMRFRFFWNQTNALSSRKNQLGVIFYQHLCWMKATSEYLADSRVKSWLTSIVYCFCLAGGVKVESSSTSENRRHVRVEKP